MLQFAKKLDRLSSLENKIKKYHEDRTKEKTIRENLDLNLEQIKLPSTLKDAYSAVAEELFQYLTTHELEFEIKIKPAQHKKKLLEKSDHETRYSMQIKVSTEGTSATSLQVNQLLSFYATLHHDSKKRLKELQEIVSEIGPSEGLLFKEENDQFATKSYSRFVTDIWAALILTDQEHSIISTSNPFETVIMNASLAKIESRKLFIYDATVSSSEAKKIKDELAGFTKIAPVTFKYKTNFSYQN